MKARVRKYLLIYFRGNIEASRKKDSPRTMLSEIKLKLKSTPFLNFFESINLINIRLR